MLFQRISRLGARNDLVRQDSGDRSAIFAYKHLSGNTPGWERERRQFQLRGGLTSTDLRSILGLGSSSRMCWARQWLGMEEAVPTGFQKHLFEQGHEGEAAAAAWWPDHVPFEMPATLLTCPPLYIDVDGPWLPGKQHVPLWVSPDRLGVYLDGTCAPVEFKTCVVASPTSAREGVWRHYPQVCAQMAAVGADHAWLVLWAPSISVDVYLVEWDQSYWRLMMRRVAELREDLPRLLRKMSAGERDEFAKLTRECAGVAGMRDAYWSHTLSK